MIVRTIGHSTRSIEDFIALLEAQDVRLLIDVRRFPGSKRHPQFNRDALAAALANAHIDYLHLEELGGRRQPRRDSPKSAWRVAGFRGYADYMETQAFLDGLDRLMAAAASRPAVILCAEASWRSCHRGLIADALKARGWEVIHIVDEHRTEAHPFTPVARVLDGRLTYAAEPQQNELDFQ